MRLIATALAAACIASAHAATIPASAFAERNQFSDATLSPDGKHIAVNVRTKRGDRDVPTLTIYSLPDLKIVSQMGLKGYEMMFAIEWVSNERLVAHKAMEIGLREAPAATGEIVAMDLNGSHFEYLYGYNMFKSSSRGKQYMNDYGHGSVARVPIEKNDHVFVSAYDWEGAKSRVFDINSRTAVRKELANLSEEGFDFVLQDDGTPRFAYGSDNDDNPVLYRADARDAWKKLPNDLARDLLPFGIQPDNKSSFAWLSKNNGPRALARYDLATGATTVLGSDPFASVGRLEWSFGARSVPIAWHAATGKPTVTYIDPADPDAQIHKMLAAQFPGLDLYIINDTLDGKKLLFWVGSDRDPGSYYLFDRTSGKADLLFSNLPNIDPEQMAERRPIRYTARDGLTIEGYLTLPANPTHKKLPLIVMPHGGPIGPRDTWYFDSDAQFLASRGYAVLQPNFRGSGGRGKAFQEAGFRQWGGKMIDDMVD
ncbi:MAG TPA: prolyl oligopeptidase family serine peptidase, partial [Telluria sp.]|nr:prolyl oligopeptidase family serine peptidase [Telluria sp.]